MAHAELKSEFQRELFHLIEQLISIDGIRFNLYLPQENVSVRAYSENQIDAMDAEYEIKYWRHDPMHPLNYDDSDVTVISNSQLMSDIVWQSSKIFKEFFSNNGYFHNADLFFRQSERIVAVLSLLRKDPKRPFTDDEIALLEKIQPFLQYSLSKVYLPKRVENRKNYAKKYDLTPRELDVVELALTGASNKVLVKQLRISQPTLRTHLQNIYAKTGVHSHSELISKLLGR